jgi:uncharacterized protein with HEPN domain
MLLDADRTRILHMIEAAREALDYAQGRDLAGAEADRPFQRLLVWNIMILGEAAARVSTTLREAHPEIPWRTIIDTRNRLIHAYFEVNLAVIWSTVNDDLPNLVPQLEAILESNRL